MRLELLNIMLFAAGVFLATTGAVLASGRLPLSARPPEHRGLANGLLLAAVIATSAGLAVASLAFAWDRLNWPVAVVAGGLAFIAAPPALQAGPAGADGLVGLIGQSVLALTAILLMAA